MSDSKDKEREQQQDDILGNKGQSGPERTQSDTMNSGARQSPPAGKIGDKPTAPKSGRSRDSSTLH